MNELMSKVSMLAVLVAVGACAKTLEFGQGLGAAGSDGNGTGGATASGVQGGGGTPASTGGTGATTGGTPDSTTGGSTSTSDGGTTGTTGGTTGTGTDPCSNGIQDANERSVDCGSTCPETRCPIGARCFDAIDCVEGVPCVDQVCSLCDTGAMDGDETDVDCGGAACAGCELGQGCVANEDCATLNCAEGVCGEAGSCLIAAPAECACNPPNASSIPKCEAVLQCYIDNACDPSSCSADNMDVCGANTLGMDAEPMNAAEDAYACACSGT